MNIVIIANFPERLDGSLTGRFIYLAESLCKRGHSVELVTSSFDHITKSKRIICKDVYKTKITYINELGYVKNISFKRLYSHFRWGLGVLKYIKNIQKPDLVYCAIPSLTAPKLVSKFCKKNKIKFVIDLQDLWPEAFAMVVKNKLLQQIFLPMKWYANKSYASADLAIAVSDTYVKRILQVNNKIQKGIAVFLGNNGEEVEKGREIYHLERTSNEIIVCYIGNLSTSYDIQCIIDALDIVKKRGNVRKIIRFVLVGSGVDENKFRKYAEKIYPNTTFLGRKKYQEMIGILCDCDFVVNPIVKGSVASIINKVGDYAMAGKPVINTQESKEYRHLVDEFYCGINCETGNPEQVADAIEKLVLDDKLRTLMGLNAMRFGREKFDRRFTYSEIIDAIEKL